jgi:hypothetical protein
MNFGLKKEMKEIGMVIYWEESSGCYHAESTFLDAIICKRALCT